MARNHRPEAPAMSVTIAPPRERIARMLEWRPAAGTSSLLGKATIRFNGGWIVTGVPIFRRADGSLSAGTPDAPLVGPDGAQLVDDAGKRRYGKVISFDGSEARRRWNDAVVDAVIAAGITGAPESAP
jgi:hypothetical protein